MFPIQDTDGDFVALIFFFFFFFWLVETNNPHVPFAVEHLAFLFAKHPGLLILTPTAPEAGWRIHPGDGAYGFSDGNVTIRNMMYVWLANSTGCPAVSCPVGYADPEPGSGSGKLPIGLMAMAEWGAEEQLLAWARETEDYLHGGSGGRRRPEEWADVVKLAGEVEE